VVAAVRLARAVKVPPAETEQPSSPPVLVAEPQEGEHSTEVVGAFRRVAVQGADTSVVGVVMAVSRVVVEDRASSQSPSQTP
jgi:hypothetical protein